MMDTLYVDIGIAEPLVLLGAAAVVGIAMGLLIAVLAFTMLFRIARPPRKGSN